MAHNLRSGKKGAQANIMSLPNEILVKIFSKTNSIKELGRLAQTCKRFRGIVAENIVWNPFAKDIVICNQISEEMQSRCLRMLSPCEKVKTYRMWMTAEHCVEPFYYFRRTYQPVVKLIDNILWFSKGKDLHWQKRNAKGELSYLRKDRGEILMHLNDITAIQFLPNLIVTGGRDGRIVFHSQSRYNAVHFLSKTQEIVDLCCTKQALIAAEQDDIIRVFRLTPFPVLRYTQTFRNHVWKVAIIGNKYVAGTAGLNGIHPLQVYDIETAQRYANLGPLPRNGAGTFCLHTESEHELISGNFNAELHLWDVRTPEQCVSHWDDLYNSSIRCVDTDKQFTIVTGTQEHGVVGIYDKRVPNRTLHVLYIGRRNSPVYSLTFEPCNLYAGLDMGIYDVPFGKY